MKNELKGIYLIERTGEEDGETKKYYVGQALDIFKRLNQHCTTKNPGIDEAISCIGVDKFTFKILEIVRYSKDLNARESYWINHYREEYGDELMYNIAQTSNTRNAVDKQVKEKIINLFHEDIGQSIYAISECFNLDYQDVINIRKPILKELGLKWEKGRIIYKETGREPEDWRGFLFTTGYVERIKAFLADPNHNKKDIRFVSQSDLDIYLRAGNDYRCAPSVRL